MTYLFIPEKTIFVQLSAEIRKNYIWQDVPMVLSVECLKLYVGVNINTTISQECKLRESVNPRPPLSTILKERHLPTKPDHPARRPFATHNIKGGIRVCMPTVVSYPRFNAYRPQDNGAPGEGELFNTYTNKWEEPNADEKELLLGYSRGDTAALGVTNAKRSMRLGRALDAHTMRWLGAMLHANQA